MLPRIPLVTDPRAFVEAGRALWTCTCGTRPSSHTRWGASTRTRATERTRTAFYRVEKMAFPKVRDDETGKLVSDRSSVIYNRWITVTGIPDEAYRYMLGSRSAVEWIIDRYQVKTDKASGIINDPNDWARDVEDPRYIVDLLARIVTVSLRTVEIVEALPSLDIRDDQAPE